MEPICSGLFYSLVSLTVVCFFLPSLLQWWCIIHQALCMRMLASRNQSSGPEAFHSETVVPIRIWKSFVFPVKVKRESHSVLPCSWKLQDWLLSGDEIGIKHCSFSRFHVNPADIETLLSCAMLILGEDVWEQAHGKESSEALGITTELWWPLETVGRRGCVTSPMFTVFHSSTLWA